MTPIYVRVSQSAEFFGISPATAYRWVQKGYIKIRKHGRTSFLKVDEVTAFIEKGQG